MRPSVLFAVLSVAPLGACSSSAERRPASVAPATTASAAPVASSSAAVTEAPPLPQAVAPPGPTLCDFDVRLPLPARDDGPAGTLVLRGSPQGKPFAELFGGDARVRLVDGDDRVALVDLLAKSTHLVGLASLDLLAPRAVRSVTVGGVFTLRPSAQVAWGSIAAGRVSTTVRLPAPLRARRPLVVNLGCGDLSLLPANASEVTQLAQNKRVRLKPGRTVAFSAEPGGPAIVEIVVPPAPGRGAATKPQPHDDRSRDDLFESLDFAVDEARGKHLRVSRAFASGTLRAWVDAGDTSPPPRIASLGVVDVPTEGTPHGGPGPQRKGERGATPGAFAVCDRAVPLVARTDDEELLVGEVRAGTCIDVLQRTGPRARVRLRLADVRFADHVTLLVPSHELAACKVFEANGVETNGVERAAVPPACLEPIDPAK